MTTREILLSAQMRAAREGDEAAYARFLAEVAAMVRATVRSRLSRLGLNTAETEDVVQEVLLALHVKRDTWDETRPILPWIHAIARHKILDTARRLGRDRKRIAGATVDDLADLLPAQEAEPVLTRPEIERLLAPLPDGQRSVVRALALDGGSIRSVADRFSMTEVAVRVAFHRALTRLSAAALGTRTGSL